MKTHYEERRQSSGVTHLDSSTPAGIECDPPTPREKGQAELSIWWTKIFGKLLRSCLTRGRVVLAYMVVQSGKDAKRDPQTNKAGYN